MKHLNIGIVGKVQKVGFRETSKYIADQIGVKGFVRNEADGSVYMEIEGDDISIEEMLNWCNEGPDRSNVEKVTVEEGAIKNFKNFDIVKR